MKMVLNELCLMHDHAFFTLPLVKLLLDPLNLVHTVRFYHETMLAGLSLLKYPMGSPPASHHYRRLVINLILSLPRRAQDYKADLHYNVFLISYLEEEDGNITTI